MRGASGPIEAAPAPAPRGAGILVNAAWRSIADLGAKLLSLALYVVMARELGTADFGVFMFALAFVTLVTTLGDFGQAYVLTREVARDRDQVHRLFANTLALRAGLALPALALALAVGAAAGIDGARLTVVALLGLAVVVEALIGTCFAVFQAYEMFALIPLVVIPQRALTAAAGITALLLGAGVETVAAIYLAGALVGLAGALAALARRVVRPRLELDPARWWPLMRLALPIGLSALFAVILFRVDTAMLAAYESDAVVGRYAAAYRLLEATLFLSWAVGTATFPVLSRLTRTSAPPVGEVLARALKLSLALALPLALGAALLADPVVRLVYGSPYAGASTALALLAPAIAAYPAAYLLDALLISQDRQRLNAWILGAVALENVLANLVLIPWLSLEGAALGTSLSQVLLLGVLLVASRGVRGRLPWTRVLAGPLVAGAAAGAVMWLARDALALALPGAAVAYVATLAAAELRWYPQDARAVLSLARR